MHGRAVGGANRQPPGSEFVQVRVRFRVQTGHTTPASPAPSWPVEHSMYRPLYCIASSTPPVNGDRSQFSKCQASSSSSCVVNHAERLASLSANTIKGRRAQPLLLLTVYCLDPIPPTRGGCEKLCSIKIGELWRERRLSAGMGVV